MLPSLLLEATSCCLCEQADAAPIAQGQDFEYRTSADSFVAWRCRTCDLVYLNPRPALSEFARIYPSNYHAFEFSPAQFGLVYQVRRRLEARRLLAWCHGLSENARILDIGCGDGFHLEVLRDFGLPNWCLEGVDFDARAAALAQRKGLTVHQGLLADLALPEQAYDLAFLIQTVEHLADPPGLLRQARALLRPGGRLVIVTDNTDSWDNKLFGRRYWGGYHFPRHWNLFNRKAMRLLANRAGLEVVSLTTAVSPVNWVYSVRNALVGKRAPSWLTERFSLKSTVSLSAFTVLDTVLQAAGRGALLNAVLQRPI